MKEYFRSTIDLYHDSSIKRTQNEVVWVPVVMGEPEQEWAESILGQVIHTYSVFKDKTKLYPEYLPDRLPHREPQLKSLAQVFKPLLTSKSEGIHRVILTGGYGTGKTATSRMFGKTIATIAQKHGLSLKYIHINCYKARTLPQVLIAISNALQISIPHRGLSSQEMMKGIIDELEDTDSYAIVALDEFDYFVQSNPENSVYFLVRMYDDDFLGKKRVHFIFITRNTSLIHSLDKSISTFFMHNVIYFPPYSSRELSSILKDRVELAFYDGTVSEEVINYIAHLEGYDKDGSGSARTAIEILMRAGESADSSGRQRVSVDDVRKAHIVVKPELAMLQDTLEALSTHYLILLLAIVKTLKKQESSFVRIGDVEETYRVLCESYGEKPRRHTQIYTYIMDMKKMRIIHTKTSGKGFRGKSTLVGISSAPLDILEARLEETIKTRL